MGRGSPMRPPKVPDTSVDNTGVATTGITDAAAICLIGASLFEYSFGLADDSETAHNNHVAGMATRYGFTGVIKQRGVAGQNFTTAAATITAAKLEMDTAHGAANVVYVVHLGGNNVSSSRPYVRADDYTTFTANLQAVYDELTVGGSKCYFMSLSKRLYVSAPAVTALPAADDDGSGPYNSQVWHPFIKSVNSEMWGAGRPVLDMYGFVQRHEDRWLLTSDGIHPRHGTWAGFQGWLLSRLAAKHQGIASEDLTGRTFAINFVQNAFGVFTNAYNTARITQQGATDEGSCVYAGIDDILGAPSYFLEFSIKGWKGMNTAGAGAGAATVTTAVLDDATLLGSSVFADATSEATQDMIWSGMTPGLTGTIAFAASRNAAGANRTTDITVDGVTKTLNAATDATENEQIFDFTVDDDGKVIATFDRNGSTWGYVSGVAIIFD